MASSESPTISSGLLSLGVLIVGCGLVGCGTTQLAPSAGSTADDAHVASSATAPPSPVTVDVVTSSAEHHTADAEGVARDALERELAKLDLDGKALKGEYSVSAKVLKLDTTETDRALVASCTVSTTLHHRDRGLVAMLQGSAQAEDAPGALARAERSAIQAAARGSLIGLPDALAQLD